MVDLENGNRIKEHLNKKKEVESIYYNYSFLYSSALAQSSLMQQQLGQQISPNYYGGSR